MTDKIKLGIIPARGGSKGVPRKNIRPVGRTSLVELAINCAKKCSFIDHIVVTTDDNEIAKEAIHHGAEVPFIRPKELAGDNVAMIPVLQHAVVECEKKYGAVVETVFLFDPTGPLRTEHDIKKAFEIYSNNDCDVVVSASLAHRNPYFNMVKVENKYAKIVIDEGNVGRRQDAPEIFDLNTVIWIFSRNAIMVEKARLPKKTMLYKISGEKALDIDTEKDFKMLEIMLKNKEVNGDEYEKI